MNDTPEREGPAAPEARSGPAAPMQAAPSTDDEVDLGFEDGECRRNPVAETDGMDANALRDFREMQELMSFDGTNFARSTQNSLHMAFGEHMAAMGRGAGGGVSPPTAPAAATTENVSAHERQQERWSRLAQSADAAPVSPSTSARGIQR